MRAIASEPMFTVHIRFEDGAQPVLYYGMKLTDVLDILKEWCVSWILIPDVGSYLDGIWTFYARPREDNGISFPEFRESFIQDMKDIYERTKEHSL